MVGYTHAAVPAGAFGSTGSGSPVTEDPPASTCQVLRFQTWVTLPPSAHDLLVGSFFGKGLFVLQQDLSHSVAQMY